MAAFVASLAVASPVAADGTVALVVGNEGYARERLPGAAGAAEALATRLETLGVDVTLVTDATRAPFERAEREFAARADGARLAIVAYAGHALRLGGSAYLVPTDVDLRSRSDLKRLPDLQRLLDTASRARHSLVMLDTCHASGFAAGWGSRYDKAPLCPGEDEGFARPDGTLLAWASETPTPKGGAEDVGALLAAFAEWLLTPVTSVPDAVDAAVAERSGTLDGEAADGWPLLDVELLASAPEAEAAADDASEEAVPPPDLPTAGRYRISDLYRSRHLGVDAAGEVVLTRRGSRADLWALATHDDDSVSLTHADTGERLAPSGAGVALVARDVRWRAEPVTDGIAGEFALREADGDGAWLVGDIGSGRLALSDAPAGTGWLLERLDDAPEVPSADERAIARAAPPDEEPPSAPPAGEGESLGEPIEEPVAVEPIAEPRRVRLTVRTVPEDARVRITNIGPRYEPGIALWPNETYRLEISHPDHALVEREVTLGDEDMELRVIMAAEAPPRLEEPAISAEDRATVTARLEALRQAIETRDMARLATLVPPGEGLDRLETLMEAYAEIDVEIRDVLGSDDGRRVSAVLRIVRLVDGFGDTVVPPPAFRDTSVYAEREDGSGWSALRWDRG